MFKTKHLKGQLGPPASGEKVYVCDVFAYSHTAPLPPVSWDPSKNIHFPKMCPPQKIEKPHDPILNCTHTWWAETFILFVQIKKIQNEKMQQKIQNAKKVFLLLLYWLHNHTHYIATTLSFVLLFVPTVAATSPWHLTWHYVPIETVRTRRMNLIKKNR